jgi:hypothetical protein
MPALASTDPVALLLTADGDLDLTDNRGSFVAGLEGFVAGALARLRLVRGEFFADRRRGMPYRENKYVPTSDAILGEVFDEAKVRAAYAAALAEVPGFGELTSLSIAFNTTTRRLTVTWQARTQFGDTAVTSTEF